MKRVAVRVKRGARYGVPRRRPWRADMASRIPAGYLEDNSGLTLSVIA